MPYRIAGHDMFFRISEIFRSFLETEKKLIDVFFQHLVRHSRHSILLMYECRDVHFLSSLHYRRAGISSRTYHNIRPERPQYLARALTASSQLPDHFKILEQMLSVESICGNKLYLISVLRHQVSFKAYLRSYKYYLCIRLPFPDLICDGQRRIYMSSCASAGHNNFHLIHSCTFSPCRDILSSTPAENIKISNAFPP